jgi:mono/diheme cytochrome c family protein
MAFAARQSSHEGVIERKQRFPPDFPPEEDAMRMGKKVACLSAGVIVALAASGCGGDAEEAAENPASDVAPAPTTAAPGADTGAAPTTTAPAAGGAPASGGGEAALVAQGQQAYATSVCVSCHGPTGQGTPLAPAFTDSEWLWVTPGPNMQAQVAQIIKDGVTQPKDPAHVAPMPPYGGVPLSDEQVEALAAYVISLSPGG